MSAARRRVLLVQLPIPPLGPGPVRGNVPLAAAYLKLFAQSRGLEHWYDLEVIPTPEASTLGDLALAHALARRRPWLVGFTCYLWNIERTLWIARELKRLCPTVRIVLGGPEITADNAWVLESDCYDFAAIGEGEQTFANLLLSLIDDDRPPVPIAGLYVPAESGPRYRASRLPAFRQPLPDLNRLGSPYLAGILDPADEGMLLLETTRGCVFHCKFCYYPKSYDRQYYLADEIVRASLEHARGRGAREVFLLDPTLNQRKDFAGFLELLAAGNPDRQMRYFAELRGEGITEKTARLLRRANFTEVEVGLQSIEAETMTLMDRKNNLRAFERGVRAMLAEGIRVKVDLIVGLPGDTVESVRRGLHWLRERELCSELQVFNLAVLPGTAFREEAAALGLRYQPRPPYYVLQTPTLRRTDLFGLVQEAQELFAVEFDALPPPVLDFPAGDTEFVWRVDLDWPATSPPAPERRAQTFTLWLRSAHLGRQREAAAGHVRRLLADNPFTTLQIVLEPTAAEPGELVRTLPPDLAEGLLAVGQESPTYLDKFYALQPGRPAGAKRVVVVLPLTLRDAVDPGWLEELGATASVVWRGTGGPAPDPDELDVFEYVGR
jgi:radical SAM superfamily enzyme YgiQ (UPF0313 family)